MASKFLFSFYQLVFLFSLVFIVEKTFVVGDDAEPHQATPQGNETTSKPTSKPVPANVTTPNTNPNATTTVTPTSQTSTVAPTNQTTAPTVPSNYTHTPLPSNHTHTPLPSNHSTPLPTTSLPSNTSTAVPTPGPTGHSSDCNTCEDKLDKERHYKWVAVAFDIIFAIAFVVMLILYLRQKKMYREMEGDGSLSRLI